MDETHVTAELARRLLAPFKEQLTLLLADLVRVNTVAVPPEGNETAGQQVLAKFLQGHGVEAELYEIDSIRGSGSPYLHAGRNYTGRKNLRAHRPGTGGGRSLLLSGHMDTVPTRAKDWRASPWEPSVRDGRMYGLGTFDMKSGVAAQAMVMVALERGGVRLRGDLLYESVVDEEWGGGGGTLAGRLRGDVADACVISESTQLGIYRATRGGFVVDLICEAGDAAAYFSSGVVVSPAIAIGRLLGWVDTWVRRRSEEVHTGAYAGIQDPTPVQVLAVESNRLDTDVPLSVPLKATVRVYLQFLPHEDVRAVQKEIRESLAEFEQGDAFFRQYPVRWQPVVEPPLLGHELPEAHPWTECLRSSATASLGEDVDVTAAPYPCDAFLFQVGYGIPTLLFGPRGAGAHNPDEYVELDSVLKTAEVLLTAALLWCGAEAQEPPCALRAQQKRLLDVDDSH